MSTFSLSFPFNVSTNWFYLSDFTPRLKFLFLTSVSPTLFMYVIASLTKIFRIFSLLFYLLFSYLSVTVTLIYSVFPPNLPTLSLSKFVFSSTILWRMNRSLHFVYKLKKISLLKIKKRTFSNWLDIFPVFLTRLLVLSADDHRGGTLGKDRTHYTI